MTSSCQHVADLLSQFLDGELGGNDLWEVTIHLEGCMDCTRFATELAATVSALQRLRTNVSRGSPRPAATTSRSTAPPSLWRNSPSSA
jgi:anti-sigma factor RsiW